MLMGLFTMSTEELERLEVIRKVVDKHLTQAIAARQVGVVYWSLSTMQRASSAVSILNLQRLQQDIFG